MIGSTAAVRHLTAEELQAGLDVISAAPRDAGVLALIVRRPRVEEREVLGEATLDVREGLVGDSWKTRGTSSRPPEIDAQLTIMSSRVVALLAQTQERWPLAGDQLYVDLDLSEENLPTRTRLAVGSAVIEISEIPHTGCKKFVERFGLDAMRFVNDPVGRTLRLRGVNTRIVEPGMVRVGDVVRKIDA